MHLYSEIVQTSVAAETQNRTFELQQSSHVLEQSMNKNIFY